MGVEGVGWSEDLFFIIILSILIDFFKPHALITLTVKKVKNIRVS